MPAPGPGRALRRHELDDRSVAECTDGETRVASGPNDIFVVTQSALDEHELFHYNGSRWSRVRTPVNAVGSKIDQLWTDGRVTYFGSGQSPSHFHALVRNETW